MAENNRYINFEYTSQGETHTVQVNLVELGDIVWNSENTQPFQQSGTWDYSWANYTSYAALGIDPADDMGRVVQGVNKVTLKPVGSEGYKCINCENKITDSVGFARFEFAIGPEDPAPDATVERKASSGVYSTCYLAHAFVGDDQYIGFLGWSKGAGAWAINSPMFIVNREYSEWLMQFVVRAGGKGYIPTGIKYDPNSKPVIGGKPPQTDPGNTPVFESDDIDNPGAPDETSASAVASGLIRPYKINTANLGNLAQCLYGTSLAGFITNLAINPLDFIVSLNIFPSTPSLIGTTSHVKLGKWTCSSGDAGLGIDVEAEMLSNQFAVVDFGTVDIEENYGSFLDYTNTQIELYLPFIGVVDIDTAEVMGGSIKLSYTIDFLTGMCVANVNCNRTVLLPDGRTKLQKSQHSYQGNCAISVPLSQSQYGQMVGSMIRVGATGMGGGIGAAGMSFVSEGLSGGFKPSVTSKGVISANAGFCSVLYPYVRLVRPISAIPESYQEANGFPSYIDGTLGDCQDLCVCDSIDLRSVSGATDSEIERIRQLCMEGVHV